MRGRIAIPIHDETGQLAAYAGRAVEDTLAKEQGKYRLPDGFKKSFVSFQPAPRAGACPLHIQRSEWKGKVTALKGSGPRSVPMTAKLAEALRAHKHLRGPRVVCMKDGKPLTQKIVRN